MDKFTQPFDACTVVHRSDGTLTAEEVHEARTRVAEGEDINDVALDYALAHAMKQDDDIVM